MDACVPKIAQPALSKADGGVWIACNINWLHRRSMLNDVLMSTLSFQDITTEADHLTRHMKECVGQPTCFRHLITAHIINMVSFIVFGKRFDDDSEEITKLEGLLNGEEMNTETLMVRLMMGYNFMTVLLTSLGSLIPLNKPLKWLNGMILSQVEERKQHLDPQNPTGVVDMWLIEQSKADSSSEPFLSRIDILVSSIMDLYFAGIETTSMTINWATKYLAKYPDMQDRIYAEIVKQIGAHGEPTFKDLAKMPFFNAFMQEVLRDSSIVPQGVEHCTTQRVKLGKYILEPNTTVTLNQYHIHHDPRYWRYPDEFNPHNFLDEAGNFKCPQQFMPFGYGSRVCIGQNLAKVELFVFLTRIIQTYKICGQDVDMSAWGDFLRRPTDQQLVLEPRQQAS
mmetsp:Transcript_4152/g.11707  ORF Transcript_4152/g.11707 Transcript_4152/m.11707 type:complete len:396 (+) Transcript_4152:715-1902(+)